MMTRTEQLKRCCCALQLLSLLVFALAGCDHTAQLEVVLQYNPEEDDGPEGCCEAWKDVVTMRFTVTKEEEGDALVHEEEGPPEHGWGVYHVSFEVVPRQKVTLEVVGYDGEDLEVGRGEAEPEIPDWGEECYAVLCFCSKSWRDLGHACACGHNECVTH